MKLQMPKVSLIGSTTRDHEDALRALIHSQSLIDFKDTFFFSDLDPYRYYPQLADQLANLVYIPCPTFKHYWEVCVWFMTEMVRYSDFLGEYILSTHWDGYPINVSAWNDTFYNYDFIGSPWPTRKVGNNGFAFYSNKMFKAIAALKLPATAEACHGSDKKIAIEYRQRLIDQGMNFCPYQLAFQFSTETYGYYDNPHGFRYNGSFGFHGLASLEGADQWNVEVPEHHHEWFYKNADKKELLSVPEFLMSS